MGNFYFYKGCGFSNFAIKIAEQCPEPRRSEMLSEVLSKTLQDGISYNSFRVAKLLNRELSPEELERLIYGILNGYRAGGSIVFKQARKIIDLLPDSMRLSWTKIVDEIEKDCSLNANNHPLATISRIKGYR